MYNITDDLNGITVNLSMIASGCDSVTGESLRRPDMRRLAREAHDMVDRVFEHAFRPGQCHGDKCDRQGFAACGASDPDSRFLCTREEGHGGSYHVACGAFGEHNYAIWRQ